MDVRSFKFDLVRAFAEISLISGGFFLVASCADPRQSRQPAPIENEGYVPQPVIELEPQDPVAHDTSSTDEFMDSEPVLHSQILIEEAVAYCDSTKSDEILGGVEQFIQVIDTGLAPHTGQPITEPVAYFSNGMMNEYILTEGELTDYLVERFNDRGLYDNAQDVLPAQRDCSQFSGGYKALMTFKYGQ